MKQDGEQGLGRLGLVQVAFTPKGGCLLKQGDRPPRYSAPSSSVAFTPKGGCLLKQEHDRLPPNSQPEVAFTPTGGCVADEWAWRRTTRAGHGAPCPYNATPFSPKVGAWRTHGCGDAQRKQGTACRAPTTPFPPRVGACGGWLGRRGRTAVRPYKRVFTTYEGVWEPRRAPVRFPSRAG